MVFHLDEYPTDWLETAPIQIVRNIELGASAAQVFAVLTDHLNWTTWFKAMRKVRIDGEAKGVGALRTVWVRGARVQEHFVRWEQDKRLTFNVVSSNLPAMAAMTEDWLLSPTDEKNCTLTITIAVRPTTIFRPLQSFVRSAVAHSTSGAAGIADRFPPNDGTRFA